MKKVVSILLAVLMLSTVGVVATSASAEETATVNGQVANVGDIVTIDYFLKSDCIWEDFQGHVTYDYDGLNLESFEMPDVKVGVMTNTGYKGFVYYTGVDINNNYKFNNEVNFYRAKFTVLKAGTYSVENVWEVADGNNVDMIVDKGVILDPSRLITREVVTVTQKPTETTKPTTVPKPTTAPTTKPTTVPTTPVVLVSGITVPKTATVNVGKTVTVKATVAPENADNKTLSWTSSNTKVATVTSNGVVKGVKAGKVTITAKSTDGSNISATCTVTVKQPVTSITLAKKATMYTGKKLTLKAKVNPANATVKTVTWKSSNTKIAKVASNGVVTGIKAGTVKITATAKDGSKKSATCTVTVRQSVTKVTLSKTTVSLAKKGASYAVKATVSPNNAYNKSMTVKSANVKVAKVSASTVSSGKAVKITAVKKGTTYVTFTAKDGSKKATKCKVIVKK